MREALGCVLQDVPRVGSKQVPLAEARGRVLAETVRAGRDVPPFCNSAMDGYALRAADVAGAGPQRPVRLDVIETIGAGRVARRAVTAGTAIRIMTGATIPEGADAVVRVEDTRELDGAVEVLVAVARGAEVRRPGEDLRAGDAALEAGRLLRPADVGLLASLGASTVCVSRRPRVAILATGDELVDVGQPLGPGQIVNSNAYALAAAVEEAGGEPVRFGIVRDDPAATRAAFAEAFGCDLVLSTGGVSVGNFDYVRASLAELGYVERFWKVAQKPGKPLTFGACGGTPAFGLPGNPVSALVCFYVYARPVLRAMTGLRAVHLPTAPATMAGRVATAAHLTEFVRCSLEGPPGNRRARSTGSQSSGVLSSLSLGSGLIVAPPEVGVLEEGAPVKVLLLAPDEGSEEAPL